VIAAVPALLLWLAITLAGEAETSLVTVRAHPLDVMYGDTVRIRGEASGASVMDVGGHRRRRRLGPRGGHDHNRRLVRGVRDA
jgi:hypothetical protein